MAELQALVEKDSAGNIKRVVRTYETFNRADEDRTLLHETSAPGANFEIIPVDHIDN